MTTKNMVAILSNRIMATSPKNKTRIANLQFQLKAAMRSAGMLPGFNAYEKMNIQLIQQEIYEGRDFAQIAKRYNLQKDEVLNIALNYCK